MKLCEVCQSPFVSSTKETKDKREKRRTCSPKCRNGLTARESAQKRGEAQRGRGEGKSYPKINNRHAHRTIAEQTLGRKLLPGEIVHHKDGNKLNFNPENLEVIASQAEHARQHSTKNRKCTIEGCKRKHQSKGLCGMHYQRKRNHTHG